MPIAQAENKLDTLERQARRKRRKCITCSDQFMSEGAHHRMCAKCRSGASAIFGPGTKLPVAALEVLNVVTSHLDKAKASN